jgi:hypothetical protein
MSQKGCMVAVPVVPSTAAHSENSRHHSLKRTFGSSFHFVLLKTLPLNLFTIRILRFLSHTLSRSHDLAHAPATTLHSVSSHRH